MLAIPRNTLSIFELTRKCKLNRWKAGPRRKQSDLRANAEFPSRGGLVSERLMRQAVGLMVMFRSTLGGGKRMMPCQSPWPGTASS